MCSGEATGFDGVHRSEFRCFDGLGLVVSFWVFFGFFSQSFLFPKESTPFMSFLGDYINNFYRVMGEVSVTRVCRVLMADGR